MCVLDVFPRLLRLSLGEKLARLNMCVPLNFKLYNVFAVTCVTYAGTLMMGVTTGVDNMVPLNRSGQRLTMVVLTLLFTER